MAVMTYVDVLRVQDFVFVSNRLRDVVAGSAMVSEAGGAKLTAVAGKHGGRVVFAAGGNALLDFDNCDQAKAFAARYSRMMLDEYPGLDVEMVHSQYANGEWRDLFISSLQLLQKRKLSRRAHAPVEGLSVTAECAETRRVATHLVPRPGGGGPVPVAAAVYKRRSRPRDDSRWEALLPTSRKDGYELAFPIELDELGRTREDTSLIGVVHIDGNQVGRRIARWLEGMDGRTDDEVRRRQASLSGQLDDLSRLAMKNILEAVYDSLGRLSDGSYGVRSRHPTGGFALRVVDGEVRLPTRPVLSGGDDLTLICDGRLALTLARIGLETFRDTAVQEFGGPVGACAGIAIVKAHAPFARAYRWAKALCREAKKKAAAGAGVGSDLDPRYYLDWHIGYGSPIETIEGLRRRQYAAGGYTLTMRPYELDNSGTAGTFVWLDETLLGRAGSGGGPGSGLQGDWWQRHRGKIKQLCELVREGPPSVTRAVESWRVTAGLGPVPAWLQMGGFIGNRTALLDAIELLDVHHPLG